MGLARSCIILNLLLLRFHLSEIAFKTIVFLKKRLTVSRLFKLGVFFAAALCLQEPALSQVSNEAVKSAAKDELRQTKAFQKDNRRRYEQAVIKARTWLDNLKVDPADLRAHGVKGKKKLAEILDTYRRFYSVAGAEDKKIILARVKTLTAVTGQTNYHDMLVINDLEFKQDATSYLRVAYLMDRFGLDTKYYREQINAALPRLNAHMPSRGVDQRMAFHWYYRHFGLAEPFPLESAFQTGLIASRKPVEWYKENPMEVYNLTHEVFAPYEFGEKLDVDFFSAGDKAYLREIIPILTQWRMERRDADLAAELILCAAYLNFTDLPAYREGLQYLLESQNPNGSWGDYERHRPAMGNYVEQGLYLHTTMVVADALIMAFEFRKP
jgi:hypothetical protein